MLTLMKINLAVSYLVRFFDWIKYLFSDIDRAVLVVNSIAALFAVVAAIIAVISNSQSKKQFAKNMVEQEKAINISLLDSRINILAEFKANRLKSNRIRIKYLFNEEIYEMIVNFDSLNKEYNRYDKTEKEYIYAEENTLQGEELTHFLELIADYQCSNNEDDKKWEELHNYGLTGKWTYLDEGITLDYIIINDKKKELHNKINALNKTIQNAIDEYIRTSISEDKKS